MKKKPSFGEMVFSIGCLESLNEISSMNPEDDLSEVSDAALVSRDKVLTVLCEDALVELEQMFLEESSYGEARAMVIDLQTENPCIPFTVYFQLLLILKAEIDAA